MNFDLVFIKEGIVEVYFYIFRNLDRWEEVGEINMKLIRLLVNMVYVRMF